MSSEPPLHLELWLVGERDAFAPPDRPGLSVRRADRAPPGAITAVAWGDDRFDFWAFDRHVDNLAARSAPLQLASSLADAAALVRQVALRTQRLAPRRNAASCGAWFDRVLDAHRALHALDRPLVRADHDHALDAWQWLLRIEPDAPAALQLAVLLHDIERLASEPDTRIEHLAADYQAFKDAHARAGAELARAVLLGAGVARELAGAAAALIAVHERRSAEPALAALSDADALSFFSFNSPGYLAYFGPEQTSAKVRYTLGRMSPRARGELAALRLPGAVRGELERVVHGDRDHRA